MAKCEIGCQCGKHRDRIYAPDREVTYRTLHQRVAKERGKAAEYSCRDCNNPAAQWATVHGTDGTDPYEHYVPLCLSCHNVYDGVADKVRAALQGRPLSEERRAAMSAAQKGRPPRNQEWRDNLSHAHTGKRLPESQREKLREIALNRPRNVWCGVCGAGPYQKTNIARHQKYKHTEQEIVRAAQIAAQWEQLTLW